MLKIKGLVCAKCKEEISAASGKDIKNQLCVHCKNSYVDIETGLWLDENTPICNECVFKSIEAQYALFVIEE